MADSPQTDENRKKAKEALRKQHEEMQVGAARVFTTTQDTTSVSACACASALNPAFACPVADPYVFVKAV